MSGVILACPGCGKKNRVPPSATGVPRCAACKAPLPWMAEANDADWDQIVAQSALPVVVDFWAEWCGPCRMVAPALEKLAAEKAGRMKLVKVNVDHSPGLSRRFAVQSIPMLGVFDHGELVASQVGAAGIDALRRWIDTNLPARP